MKKTPVMILFFNRPQQLQEVFDAVKAYQPDELFLVQDGARSDHPDDIDNISKCRQIAEDINWDCKVHKNYAQENMSCDYREFTGISWCFEHVDRLIILEDDCVPTPDFFKLCDECLEKYENNAQIHSIYGYNRLGKYSSPYDYVFSTTAAGIGWATWKRVWDEVQRHADLAFIEDINFTRYYENVLDSGLKKNQPNFLEKGRKIKEKNNLQNKITSWEYAHGAILHLNNMLTIAPTKNTIKYIGICANATHAHEDIRLLPRKTQKLLSQPTFNQKGELKHPPFIVRDVLFEKKTNAAMKTRPVLSKIEILIRRFRYYGIGNVIKYIFKR